MHNFCVADDFANSLTNVGTAAKAFGEAPSDDQHMSEDLVDPDIIMTVSLLDSTTPDSGSAASQLDEDANHHHVLFNADILCSEHGSV